MKKLNLVLAAAAAGTLLSTTASAVTFTAASTGDIKAYFYGQTAGYGSDIGLWVNGVFQGVYGLQNHTASPGDSLVLGSANAGDTLVFELRVSTTDSYGPPPWDYSLFSDPTLNAGNFEYTTASAFAGGPFGIPAGTLVGFEDILGGGDLDFDDHQFVFTNTRYSTPDTGSTLALAGLGLLGLGFFRRR